MYDTFFNRMRLLLRLSAILFGLAMNQTAYAWHVKITPAPAIPNPPDDVLIYCLGSTFSWNFSVAEFNDNDSKIPNQDDNLKKECNVDDGTWSWSGVTGSNGASAEITEVLNQAGGKTYTVKATRTYELTPNNDPDDYCYSPETKDDTKKIHITVLNFAGGGFQTYYTPDFSKYKNYSVPYSNVISENNGGIPAKRWFIGHLDYTLAVDPVTSIFPWPVLGGPWTAECNQQDVVQTVNYSLGATGTVLTYKGINLAAQLVAQQSTQYRVYEKPNMRVRWTAVQPKYKVNDHLDKTGYCQKDHYISGGIVEFGPWQWTNQNSDTNVADVYPTGPDVVKEGECCAH